MPYIGGKERKHFSNIEAAGKLCRNSGELNYSITLLIKGYLDNHVSYQVISEVSGVLDNVSKEFYRRIAVPYEDRKIAMNGDVYL